MSLPSFSKAGVTTVTLTTGNVFPHVQPIITNQFIGVTDAATVTVATVGPALRTILLEFEQLTAVDRDAIYGFFADPLVNYAANSFTFTDARGNAYTCRYLEPALSLPEVAEDDVKASMVLTVIG